MDSTTPLVDEARELQDEIESLKNPGSELRRLSEFLKSMNARGLVRKQEYDLPLLDTVGADPRLRSLIDRRMREPT